MNADGSTPRSSKQKWLRFIATAFVPFVLICLWRSSLAAQLRPSFELGMPWLALVKAWFPEGLLLGVIALFAQRWFADRPPSRLQAGPVLIYLVFWLLIWALAVLLPALVVVGPLAEHLAPLKDVARIGGIMGAFLGGALALAFIGLYGALNLVLMVAGLILATWLAPAMTQLATSGRFASLGSVNGSWLRPLLLFGACYWVLYLLGDACLDPAAFAIVAPVEAVALIGLCADQLRKNEIG